MSDTAIMGENVEVIQATGRRSPFTWSVVIAGALAAWAVSFILISLGSGIGLSLASPYSGAGPSAGTLGITGAVWLIFALTLAFAVGGYLAARLRVREHIAGPETRFRDGAHGFMAWVVGAAAMALALFAAGIYSAKSAADVAGIAGIAGSNLASSTVSSDQSDRAIGYFVDQLFRGGSPGATTTAGTPPSQTTGAGGSNDAANQMPAERRAEVARIVLTSIGAGRISDPDRQYLAQLVASRTGISPDEAARRVAEVQDRALARVTETADSARKAAAYLSFWSFMALLFGAVGATLAGMLGGELRDRGV